MAKKVLLIPNMPYWAVDKCAKDLVKYNRSDIVLTIAYYSDFLRDYDRLYNEYDLLFPMYTGLFFRFLSRDIPADKTITGVRSYFLWDDGKTVPPGYNVKPPRHVRNRLKKALLVNTICRKLWYLFSPYLRIVHTRYGCDLELYFPDRKPGKSRSALVVGWAGSLTNHPGKRGFYDIIEPACAAVEGVELKVQNCEKRWITDDGEMRGFYNSLDLYLCASRTEGTPRTMLEAAACGVPVLTTDVGLAPELVEQGVNGFVVERTREAFVQKLSYLAAHRETLPVHAVW